MAITEKEEKQEEAVFEKPAVHHMVRGVSKMNLDDQERGWRSVPTLDAEVGMWIKEGYELKWVHYLGEAPEFYQILYIFVLKQ